MKDPLHDMLNGLPPDGPDNAWLTATRRQLLDQVAAKRRLRRRASAGWVAALAASAVALCLSMLMPTSGITFAAVQQSIERARTIQFQSTLSLEQDGRVTPLSTARSWTDRDLGVRLDINALGMPLAQFWLPHHGQPVLVDHTHRAIVPIQLPDTLDAQELLRFDPTTLVRRLSHISADVQPISADSPQAPPRATGFRFSANAVGLSGDSTLDLWVNADSHLPQLITVRVPLNDHDALVWTLDHFVWYQPIRPDVLLIDFPSNYERIDPLVVPNPGEEPLRRMLKRFAQLENGRFPSTDMVAWETIAKMVMVALRPASAWADLPTPMNTERGQREALGDAIAGGLFCFQLQENDARPIYFGNRVRLGDEQTLIRWRLADGSTRQINGRLESETTP